MTSESWDFRLRRTRKIVDGDTFDLEVDLGFRQYGVYRFRLANIDTPEVWGVPKDEEEYQRGIEAITFVSNWFREKQELGTVWVRTYNEQTFNRWVASIHSDDGASLAEDLKDAGFDAKTT